MRACDRNVCSTLLLLAAYDWGRFVKPAAYSGNDLNFPVHCRLCGTARLQYCRCRAVRGSAPQGAKWLRPARSLGPHLIASPRGRAAFDCSVCAGLNSQ